MKNLQLFVCDGWFEGISCGVSGGVSGGVSL